MVSDSAALVLFAIRSAVRLGQQGRRAYVESTQRRAIVLPLPDYFAQPGAANARVYFDAPARGDFRHAPAAIARLRAGRDAGSLTPDEAERLTDLERLEPSLTRLEGILDRWDGGLTPAEEAEAVERHREVFQLLEFRRVGRVDSGTPKAPGPVEALTSDEFVALLAVRQWARGDGPPTALHRLAATFIEIGADYLQNVPGALDLHSRQGRIVAGFLEAMEKIDIAEVPVRELPGRFFVATLETLGEHPELVAADERARELVGVAAGALARNVGGRILDLRRKGRSHLLAEESLADWGELVLRSLLGSAGRLVVEQPGRFLGVADAGQEVLIARVGDAFLDAIADAPEGRLASALSRETLDEMLRAALGVVAEHPEVVGLAGDAPLTGLLTAVAEELAGAEALLTRDALPVVTRMILVRTGDQLPLLWPDFAAKPENHLLLTAAGTTLRLLARDPAEGSRWTARFGRAEALELVEVVLDEVVSNPGWLVDGAKGLNRNLGAALEACLDVLRERADERLGGATARALLRAAVHAVTLRLEFLNKLPAGATVGAGRRVIGAVLDAVLAAVFDEDLDARAAWQLARGAALEALFDVALRQLARTGLTPDAVAALAKILHEQVADVVQGNPLDLEDFAADLTKELGLP